MIFKTCNQNFKEMKFLLNEAIIEFFLGENESSLSKLKKCAKSENSYF
jgi:hypothetical protein